ncbi:NAD(P)H-hydrate dehydratase [Pseudomonas typographi]|uniref:NAD(P)H-hydrate dehydratase n=1 Tax=Pseudomonas typographi TaxID=2715964 RepID=UPI001682D6AD|nr:NAD(P)H-hydrate dehydratase [Pseudomonas typographi]MBD1551803.1 NAD(P)H-hydrate dehydratase [Pseudomonas typographi]
MPTDHRLSDHLYSAAQVRELDARLIAAGTPGFELMQRAALATWRAVRRRWPQAGQLTVLAGHGNNAGDGYLVACLAHRAGWAVQVWQVVEPGRLRGDAAQAHAQAVAGQVPMAPWHAGASLAGVVLDALLGTGLKGEVRAPYAAVIETLNNSSLPVVAVDIPSGLCADTGSVLGQAVRAQLTVTFIGLKLGLFTGQAADQVGEVVFDCLQASASIIAAQPPAARLLAPDNLVLPARRAATAHKGQFGRVLVIGGDHGTGGATLMSAEMALRGGAGMVSLATRAEHVGAALVRLPEVMAAAVQSANQLLALAEPASVLVVGPGLGQGAWGHSLLSVAAASDKPQVWDADALNLVAQGAVRLPAQAVITPHPGEAARLLGLSTPQVQADRPAAVRALAERYGCVVVLKGSGSLVAAPNGSLAVCAHGHPAMATGGLGDVLAGLIGALLGQHVQAFDAACLGVWLHAMAGERQGAKGRGLAAADLIPTIRQLLEEIAPCRR